MTRIDTMRPFAALGLGFALSSLNPKNLLLVLSAAVTIAQAELSKGDEAITIGVFTLVGASTVIVPTVAFLVAGQRVQPTLDHAKAWLGVHNSAVMSVLLLVIGVSLVGKGLGAVL
jgi:threonine/homoserine/homoserine lactone efflux protein